MKINKLLLLLIVCCLICSACHSSQSDYISSSWGVELPEPESTEIIFSYKYIDSESFEIWQYDDSLESSMPLSVITDENIDSVMFKYNNVLDDLSYDNQRQNIVEGFLTDVVKVGNYFEIIKNSNKPGCYLMAAYDVTSQQLFLLSWIM